jgi:hypothetical protein
MRALFKKLFAGGYVAIVVLFGACAFGLIAFAALDLWHAYSASAAVPLTSRFNLVLEAVAMLTIALASLDLADTVIEEEFKREPQMGAAARVRRVLGRFLLVVVVSLSIESLVAVFQLVHDDPSKLLHASAIAVGAAALLVGWGLFLRLSREPDSP